MQRGEIVGFDLVEPGGQIVGTAPLGHDRGEGVDVSVESFEVLAGGGGLLHLERVFFGEVVGVCEQPAADVAGLGYCQAAGALRTGPGLRPSPGWSSGFR